MYCTRYDVPANKRMILSTTNLATHTSVSTNMQYNLSDIDIMTPIEEKADASDNVTTIEFERISLNLVTLVFDKFTISDMLTSNKTYFRFTCIITYNILLSYFNNHYLTNH